MSPFQFQQRRNKRDRLPACRLDVDHLNAFHSSQNRSVIKSSCTGSKSGKLASMLLGSLVFVLLLAVPGVQAANEFDAGVAEQVNKLVQSTVAGHPVTLDNLDPLYRAAVLQDGSVESLLQYLERQRRDATDSAAQGLAEIEVHVAARRGDLRRASDVLNDLLKIEQVAAKRVDLRLWQARLFDALGDVDDAKKTYQALSKEDLAEADQQMVRLRLALMGLLGTDSENAKVDAKELIELANRSTDIGFRNRAANVLAVQNQHSEAVKLFTIEGEGTSRFRGASRVSEWAIRAGDRDKAIESAWDAVRSSELKRDRRYSLALLVESYRMAFTPKPTAATAATPVAGTTAAGKVASRPAASLVPASKVVAAPKIAAASQPASAIESETSESEPTKKQAKPGLEALVEAFAEENAGDKPLSDEMRAVWVELLRELGRHDDAIALFKSSAQEGSGFSVEMRRELLEMEGDAGNNDRLIASYRELIRDEPDQLIWRGGLTRILLEQGKDKDAAELWHEYLDSQVKGSQLLMAAQTLGNVGLDELATKAVERMVTLKVDHGQALLYLADLQQSRGRVDDAEATLSRIEQMPDVGDAVRSELAGAFERVGRQDKAIEVTEAIREQRETVAEDVEMRLAWLYSEIGDEDKALQQWLTLWRKITSIPRRRYVEDRLMTVASRLGTLADIAIELEEKLADGKADDREAGLLVRIYSRVNDSVAASEILEEYMTQTGRNEIDRLQEKGRIYQICNDYWNYEKVVERLIEVDPEGKTEYLRQLALSMLERGKAQEARAVLLTLRGADDGKDSIGGEFEAGVLSLVGMNADAADAYRRGIATYPDRIESYLLLANLLKEMGQTDRAVGMFQYLAENADRDDLFTIAIDGLLNMEAKGKVMQWARRITLERLAAHEDKNYLYQLLADLSAEVNDKAGQIRAMENSLAVSGTRRLSVLRECMDLSSRIRGGVFYSSSSRGPTNAGNKPFFAFGRRLIGLGELMPPQVFLDLGQAFLADGDLVSAERTFGLARNLADERSYEREVAAIFEKSGKRSEALVRYDRLLRTSPSDVALMARVAKLNEQEGRDDVAFRFYQRGLNLLLAQTPLTTLEDTSKNNSAWSYGRNRDAYQTYSDRLLRGLLVTVSDESVDSLLLEQRKQIVESLAELSKRTDENRRAVSLQDSPRLEKQVTALRRMYFAFDRISDLESLEFTLIRQFESDQELLISFARERLAYGRYDSVRRLRGEADLSDEQQKRLAIMLGEIRDQELSTQQLSPNEMWQRFLPVWMSGDMERARAILRRVDQSQGTSQSSGVSYVIINGMAVLQQTGSATTVSAWMRMAQQLGDEGLALQFARSRLTQRSRYGSSGVKQLFDGYRDILPPESFQALARYAANLYKDDEDRRYEYLWIISQLRDQLGDDLPSDEQLLEMVEESDLTIGYQFPFDLAIETFPESIRSQALAHVIDGIDKKSRPRELFRIPFQHRLPIDEETAKVILEAIESGIQPALQDNYLQYAIYYLPRQGAALQCPENAELAIAALDLLSTDVIRKRDERIASIAENTKAVILHQAGRTEEALDLVIPQYDPEKQVSDYYHRNSLNWVHQELIPAAPDRFLEVIEKTVEKGKRTTKQTDQRLAIITQTKDDQRLLQGYEQAIKDHPDESKYFQRLVQLEQRAGRVAGAIAVNERQLSRLPDDAAGKAKAKTIQKQLAELWFSVDHRVNGLPYWSVVDEEDRVKFDAESKAREQTKKESKVTDTEKDSATQQSEEEKSKAAEKEEAKTKEKKTYPKSIVGVKAAMKDSDVVAAGNLLREIWRNYPQVEESPYSYRSNRQRINGLTWPADAVKTEVSQPSDAERREQEEAARQKMRGGLATFTPPEPRSPTKRADSAWKVLAAEPFGVAEMRRMQRSRTAQELTSISDVVLGLLQADRLERGDKTVFDALVEKLENGQSSTVELTQFFTMLEEDPSRIDSENQSVIDVLLQQLDLTQLKMASQLADVCGAIGQHDRAAALYTHCALLAPSQGVTFSSLVGKASEVFKGDRLIELAEQMFAVATHDTMTINRMLDLRMELLPPEKVAERSADLFANLDDDSGAFPVAKAIRGAQLFSQVGELNRAWECLKLALVLHGKPAQQASMSYYSYGNVRNVSVSRADLLRVFPEDASRIDNYSAWLATAAAGNVKLVESKQIEHDIAIELQAIIAFRQCQHDQRVAAVETLELITKDRVALAESHELLVIDVLREANLVEQALGIQSWLYQQGQLSHLRFGDLLRDTSEVEGVEQAILLADELLAQSLDDDLLMAAIELMPHDPFYADRLEVIIEQRQAAEQEFRHRTEAAKQRKKTRDEWKEADQAK